MTEREQRNIEQQLLEQLVMEYPNLKAVEFEFPTDTSVIYTMTFKKQKEQLTLFESEEEDE